MSHRDHRNQLDIETQVDFDLPPILHELLDLLVEHGFDGMAQAMQTLLNEAMKLERCLTLGARRDFRSRGIAFSSLPARLRDR